MASTKVLDLIQNSAPRIATGTFCISPAVSLCAETGALPLHYRRLSLTAKFLTIILKHPEITTYNHIFHPPPNIHNDNLRTHLEQQPNLTFKYQTLTPILPATPHWLFPSPQSTKNFNPIISLREPLPRTPSLI